MTDLFAEARARAAEIAPEPADRPLPAALAAGGWGLAVIGLYAVLNWFGLPVWLSWPASAAAYAGIAWADSAFAWKRHVRQMHEALADLRDSAPGNSHSRH